MKGILEKHYNSNSPG